MLNENYIQIADWFPGEVISSLYKDITCSDMPYRELNKQYIDRATLNNDENSFLLIDYFDDDIFEYVICRFKKEEYMRINQIFKHWVQEGNQIYNYHAEPILDYPNVIEDENHQSNLRLKRWTFGKILPGDTEFYGYDVWLKLNSIIEILPSLCEILAIDLPENYQQVITDLAETNERPLLSSLTSSIDNLCYLSIGYLNKEGYTSLHIRCRKKFNCEIEIILYKYLTKSGIPEKDISLMLQNWVNNPSEEYKNLQRKYFLENHKPL